MSKYPYIPDKRMYAAVMGACSYIRESGWFNKAVTYYAEKYDVDSKELADHIRARQSAGQAGKKRGKFKWFVVAQYVHCQYRDEWCEHEVKPSELRVIKALNKENAEAYGEPLFYNNNECYQQVKRVPLTNGFESKREAEEEMNKMKEEMLKVMISSAREGGKP